MDYTDILTREEQRGVISSLLSLTSNDRIRWKQGSRDDVFTIDLGEHTYILQSRDRDGLLPYRIEIFIINRPQDAKKLAEIITRGPDDEDYDDYITRSMKEIFTIAYRFTHRSESEVESLLSELDKIDRGDLPPF